MDPILHDPLAKSQPEWCRTGSSLGSSKWKLFSATEIEIPLSHAGSLPSSTEAFSLFSHPLGTSSYQVSQYPLLLSCSRGGQQLQGYLRVCKATRGKKPVIIPVLSKLNLKEKSWEIGIHTEVLEQALTTKLCKLLFLNVSMVFCRIPSLVVLCWHRPHEKQKLEFFWDIGNSFYQSSTQSTHPLISDLHCLPDCFNSFSVNASCLHHPWSSSLDRVESMGQCVK